MDDAPCLAHNCQLVFGSIIVEYELRLTRFVVYPGSIIDGPTHVGQSLEN